MATQPNIEIHNHVTRDEMPELDEVEQAWRKLEANKGQADAVDPHAVSGVEHEVPCPHCNGTGVVSKGDDDEHEQPAGEQQNLSETDHHAFDSLKAVNISNLRANGKRTRDQQARPKTLREMNSYLQDWYHGNE
jgi:hypothetical protein